MALNGQLMRDYSLVIVMFLVMTLFQLTQAQMAPSPAPSNDSASIDQGIAYILMLVALAVTYLIH
ncbi:hypothetical protein RND81_07G100100 [Saponaria officinalis]|uniref:Uncharacterized protein n=1 Tax=Saponaria officinalis TaxID=3572 RepID=A0AAW1JLQ6_SAPOF